MRIKYSNTPGKTYLLSAYVNISLAMLNEPSQPLRKPPLLLNTNSTDADQFLRMWLKL